MAAPPKRRLNRRLSRALVHAPLALLAGAVLALLAYLLMAWIGSSIPRNGGWQEPETGVEIMVETNGVHTAIIMPLATRQMDWRQHFPASDVRASDRRYTHVSVSWGEKQVFLETKEWKDLSPITVLRIIGVGGEGLLHVAHYVRPAPSEDVRVLTISPGQYALLIEAIEQSIPQGPLTRHDGYGEQDVFYDAPGAYTATNTCNQWTSDVLAAAGVRTGWWTPFPGGVMKWVEAP